MGVSIPNKRSWTARAAALAATAGAAFYGIAAGDVAHAGTSTLVTVTAVSPHVVAADTANRVITVTGTGFDEDVITGVTIAGCTTAPSYVVSSATTLLVKTAADCDPATGAVITVTDTSSNTAVSDPTATGGKMKLDFVAPPTPTRCTPRPPPAAP
jgi:hypothetical protein